MNNTSISLCVIAKNEEKNIVSCLQSCRHFVDEIIVVDTGSTDNTIALAKALGAKVIEEAWTNDFAKARNTALDHVTKDWVIYLDCDERMDFEDGTNLKAILAEKQLEGVSLILQNKIQGQVTMESPSLRIFRNRKDYRFEGRIHETIYPSMTRYGADVKIKETQLKCYHYGYDQGSVDIQSKSRRNLEILGSYTEAERDSFYYYNLGGEYLRLEDNENAIICYQKSLVTPGVDTGHKLYLPIYLVKALYDTRRYAEGVKYAEDCLRTYETYKDMHFLLMGCHLALQSYHKAYEHLMKYIEYSKKNYGYPDFRLGESNDIGQLKRELEKLGDF